jgi:hypothetical protein
VDLGIVIAPVMQQKVLARIHVCFPQMIARMMTVQIVTAIQIATEAKMMDSVAGEFCGLSWL